MALRPNNWVEEDREKFAETIADAVVKSMTLKTLQNMVWDMIFEEMMGKDWPDLWSEAEDYAPHLIEPLLSEEVSP